MHISLEDIIYKQTWSGDKETGPSVGGGWGFWEGAGEGAGVCAWGGTDGSADGGDVPLSGAL